MNEEKSKVKEAESSKAELLLQELAKELGCEDGTPEEIERAVKKRKLRNELEARATRNNNEKRYRSILLEAKALGENVPDFKLEAELEKPDFLKLIRCGFDVASAYKFTHMDEILEKNRLEAENAGYEEAVALLRSGSLRPEENGMREQAGISEKKNVAGLTGGGIRDILRRVEKGAKVKF